MSSHLLKTYFKLSFETHSLNNIIQFSRYKPRSCLCFHTDRGVSIIPVFIVMPTGILFFQSPFAWALKTKQ